MEASAHALSEPSPHPPSSRDYPPQPPFSSLFGIVEGEPNPNEEALDVEQREASTPSSSAVLSSFTPFLESVSSENSPLLAEVAALRRAEVELQIQSERRRAVEAELELERLRAQRETREREAQMYLGQQQQYYQQHQQPVDPHHPYPYQQKGYSRPGEGRDASSSAPPSPFFTAGPTPTHFSYPSYPDSRRGPVHSPGSDPYANYQASRPEPTYSPHHYRPPPHPSSYRRQSSAHQHPVHPYNPSQTSLDSFGQDYQLGSILDYPPFSSSEASERQHPSTEFVRPTSLGLRPPGSRQQSSSRFYPRDRSSASTSASSASAQTPQHTPYPSYPHLSGLAYASPLDQPHSASSLTFPNTNGSPFEAKGFANAPARSSVSSTSTLSNGRNSISNDDNAVASSSTAQSFSSSHPAGVKKKRYLNPDLPIAHCSDCSQPIAKLYLRGDKSAFDVEWEGWWSCSTCRDRAGKGKAKDEGVSRRKRNRETQDIDAPLICDVCMKEKGQGGIVAKDGKSPVDFSVEFVCTSCELKYQRCSDCGGGGGGRVGIGKWRSKQLFIHGRKTCSLAHTRIGAAPLELGVWEIGELEALGVVGDVVRHCERMWADRTLARMAVPDVLEVEGIDRDGVKIHRTFQDIQNTLDRGWPSKDHVTGGKEPTELNISRRYLGLTWVKTRSRRGAAPDGEGIGELEEDSHEQRTLDDTALANIKKISGDFPQVKPLVIPAGSELVGLWVGDWNMINGTLLISTSLPFEGSDGDDRSALTVGEIACRIVSEIDEINSQRLNHATTTSGSYSPPLLVPPLEHLWVISDGTSPHVRERMTDILQRRRQFLPLDDYLERHPNVRPEIFTEFKGPLGGDGWADSGGGGAPAQVLVRWLGPHFDKQRLEELAGSEFGKKLKSKKKR